MRSPMVFVYFETVALPVIFLLIASEKERQTMDD